MRNINAPHKIRYRKLQEERHKNRIRIQRVKIRKEIKEQQKLVRRFCSYRYLTPLEREIYGDMFIMLSNLLEFWSASTKEKLWEK